MNDKNNRLDADHKERLRQIAKQHGLYLLGVIRLEPDPLNYSRFESWLESGKHAGMDFLTLHMELRRDPRGLMVGAKTAFILALPYALGDQNRSSCKAPLIAQYARYRDYHKTLKQKATLIWKDFTIPVKEQFRYRILVDSAPVLERSLATMTERGFVGKNTCYIHPQYGSFLLLVSIISDMDLKADIPAMVDPRVRKTEGGCGSCRRCQVYCPTGALTEDYQLDANLCLAYWTIEHRGTIPFQFWPFLKKYWFGCDICQNVCPYNRNIDIPSIRRQEARTDLEELDLFQVAVMDQEFYERTFGGTPLTRAKRNGLRRNALIALAVTNDERLFMALNIIKNDSDSMIQDTMRQVEEWITGR